MTRAAPPRGPLFSNPLLLGFDEIERLLDQVSKTGNDGYPPYNIEQISNGDETVIIKITFAVAGFSQDDLDITIEENQLVIRGKQEDDGNKAYLHHGIAARQFQKVFVLADGIEVGTAHLKNGLLSIELKRPQMQKVVRKIKISHAD